MHSPSVAEYENEDIPKIHLAIEKPLWDPSTNEYLEQDFYVGSSRSDQYPCHSSIGISICILYSVAYDAANVMDDNNLMTALSAQIYVSIVRHSQKAISRANSIGLVIEHYQPQYREGLELCSLFIV